MELPFLPPLPVALPLLVAAVLAAMGRFMPRRVADALAVLTTLTVTAICLRLMQDSADNPIVSWFGGWFPRKGVAVGISLVIDPIGAGLGALTGLLTTAAFLFSVRYFDALGAMFHVLIRKAFPPAIRQPVGWLVGGTLGALRQLHTGHVGDYVAWLTLGVAGFGGLCAWWLR